MGVIVPGVLTGHRTTPGSMPLDRLTDAFVLAGSLSSLLIGAAAHPDTPTALLAEGQELHFADVHQATKMFSAQLAITPAQALVRLRAHAFGHDTPCWTRPATYCAADSTWTPRTAWPTPCRSTKSSPDLPGISGSV
ncbi:hypothetical protein [Streptomyces sp. NBC_00057]|uniref:hypothetical protein n=1 Tax=Streptomyces sp. NBC_00057 TaxID=2975634 RepID=UPI002F912336